MHCTIILPTFCNVLVSRNNRNFPGVVYMPSPMSLSLNKANYSFCLKSLLLSCLAISMYLEIMPYCWKAAKRQSLLGSEYKGRPLLTDLGNCSKRNAHSHEVQFWFFFLQYEEVLPPTHGSAFIFTRLLQSSEILCCCTVVPGKNKFSCGYRQNIY